MIFRRQGLILCLLSFLVASGLSGCGTTFGGLLYHLVLAGQRRVPAKFKLTQERLLILVDDDLELLSGSITGDLLVEQIARKLAQAGVNLKAVPNHQIVALRRSDPQFAERSISDLAETLGGEQVLWVQVRDFWAKRDFETATAAARFTVRVKVFDPRMQVKAEMRLWPEGTAGEFVTVEKDAVDIHRAEADDEIARMLITEMADQLAKLFYTHVVEE